MSPSTPPDPPTLPLAAADSYLHTRVTRAVPALTPADQEAFDSLIALWEDARQRGMVLAAADLAAEQPHLLAPLDDAVRDRCAALGLTASTTTPPTAPPGYRLLGELGRGGMGVVYRADQTTLNRPVALKMILGGAHASPHHLLRFLAEAEVIARMTHPNIVQVHEFGRHNDHPFFALEFCAGGSLEKRLRDEPQEARYAADLVAQLADALAAVHAQGIVHRDLKPDNVLLTDAGVPKVTDFGLARQGSAELTTSGTVLGTPTYMAPEQARGEIHRIGPAADIWALGAILYRMLTGRVPFRGASVPETLQLVVHDDPVPIRTLIPGCPRDLETIALKCLQKEPSQRFASALALRDDLRAWLAGRPISARPVGPLERAGKWARRNPVIASLAALVLLGAVGLAILAQWAWQQKQAAEQHADEAHRETTRANEERRLTRQALDILTDEYIQKRLEAASQLSAEDKAFLQRVVVFYEQFARQGGDTPTARAEHAGGLAKVALLQARLGQTTEAIHHYEAARDLCHELVTAHPNVQAYRQELANAQHQLGNLYSATSRLRAAETELVAARTLQAELVADQPDVAAHRQHLARIQNNLGLLFADMSRIVDAETELTAARSLQTQLVAEAPGNSSYHRDLAITHNNLANLCRATGQLPAAEAQLLAAQSIQTKLANAYPGLSACRQELAHTHHNLGNLYYSIQQFAAAETQFAAARAEQLRLVNEHPGVGIYRQELATTHNNLGNVYNSTDRLKEAETQFKAALALQLKLVAEHPSVTEYAVGLGGTQCNLGNLADDEGRPARALEHYNHAIATLTAVVARDQRLATAREYLRNAHWGKAETLRQLGRHAESATEWSRTRELDPGPQRNYYRQKEAWARTRAGQPEQALALVEPLLQGEPTAEVRYDLAGVLAVCATAQRDEALAARAVAQLRQAWHAGYRDRAEIVANRDWAGLRKRADYQAFLAEAQAWREPLSVPPRLADSE